MRTALDLLGEEDGTCFYVIVRFQMTRRGVTREEGFTSEVALMKMAPDKMINYCESRIQRCLAKKGGVWEMGVELI